MPETDEGKAFVQAVEGSEADRRAQLRAMVDGVVAAFGVPGGKAAVGKTADLVIGLAGACPCGCGRPDSITVETRGGVVHLASRDKVEHIITALRRGADQLWPKP
jgi:hypothetical protein